METSLKDLIISKVDSKLDKISNDRVLVKNYNEIKAKNLGDFLIFFHKNYSRNNIEYLNEEEDTDFLVFEDNLVYVDYSENLFNFHKVK